MAKISKLEQQRKELRELRNELKLTMREITDKQNLLHFYEQTPKIQPNKIERIPFATAGEENGAIIALLSDIHGEHKITKAQTHGANFLSPMETERRLANYARNLVKLTEIMRESITLDTLIWGFLGDMIHGFIHEEYIRTNYMTPPQAALWMTSLLGGVIQYVIDHGKFEYITIVCKIGNHSRITHKVYTDEEAAHSYEWGIYHALANKFNALKWVIDESYFTYVRVYDKILRFHHGHAFRYMGGIGGIHIPLLRYISKVNRQRRADMDIMGHWHTRIFDATDGYLVNGSVCGVDGYSIRLGFPIEEPTQQFQILDRKRGFTINAPIMVTL